MGRPFGFHSRERGAGIDERVNSPAATARGAAVFDDPILSATTRLVARTADECGIVTLVDGRTFRADDHGQSAVAHGQGAGGSDACQGSRSVVSASRGRPQRAMLELSTCQGSEAHADLTDFSAVKEPELLGSREMEPFSFRLVLFEQPGSPDAAAGCASAAPPPSHPSSLAHPLRSPEGEGERGGRRRWSRWRLSRQT